MPKRALITGITGQDGSYLAELLGQLLDDAPRRAELARVAQEHALSWTFADVADRLMAIIRSLH